MSRHKGKGNCPHCGHTDADVYLDSDVRGTLEEKVDCDCGYIYTFAYGYHTERIPGEPEMYWSYDNPEKRAVPDTPAYDPDDTPDGMDELPF